MNSTSDGNGGTGIVRPMALGLLVGGLLGVVVWLATNLFWLFVFFAGAGAVLGLFAAILLRRSG